MDPLPHLNQLTDNVDGNIEDGVENIEDTREDVVFGNEIRNEIESQVGDGRNEVVEDRNGSPNVAV